MRVIKCVFCGKEEPKEYECKTLNTPFLARNSLETFTIPYNSCMECIHEIRKKFLEFLKEKVWE